MTAQLDPGWHPDPTGRHEHRYWDGAAWTDDVADGGMTNVDPVDPAGVAEVGEQPVPGSDPGAIPPPVATPPRSGPPSGRSKPDPTVLAVIGVVAVGVLAAAVILLLARGDDSGESADDPERSADDPERSAETTSAISAAEARAAISAAGITCEGEGSGSVEASAQFLRGALLDAEAPDPVEPADGFECDTDAGRLAFYEFGQSADASAYADLWAGHAQTCVATAGGENWFAIAVHDMNDGSPPAVATAESVAEALGGGLLEDCGGGGGFDGGSEPAAETPDGASGGAYPQTVVDSFMASCTVQGASEASCRCTIDRIQATVGLSEFIELEQESVATGELAPPLQEAVDACR